MAAVLALNQLQGRTPVVWMITALVAAVSLGSAAASGSNNAGNSGFTGRDTYAKGEC
jgi:hypothetical protein